MSEKDFTACEEAISYHFNDSSLLRLALTHSSKKPDLAASNERLEFLGDAIVGLVVSAHLFEIFPDSSEGELTKAKSVLVSRNTLARISKGLGLDRFMMVAKGVTTPGPIPQSLLANVYEAIVGAIYLDGGIRDARAFVLRTLKAEFNKVIGDRHEKDYKSLLQQYAQKELKAAPVYRKMEERGPDHEKAFRVVAVIAGKEYCSAWGNSKKQAEQAAAAKTLKMLGQDRDNDNEDG